MRATTLSYGLFSESVRRIATPEAQVNAQAVIARAANDGIAQSAEMRSGSDPLISVEPSDVRAPLRSPSNPLQGELITKELMLVKALGEGGMGCVWLAEHVGLGRSVAVKFLRHELVHDVAARERFRREASAVARLDCENIVEVLEDGETTDGLPYIVMELLDGQTLQDRIFGSQLSITELGEILRQVCDGLGRAHEAGIIHRDIKPDNIFLVAGDKPLVKLLDFGIARDLEQELRVTTTNSVVGTPLFMAPEQMSGEQTLPASDVWSLGVVIYNCMTGRLPYRGASLAALALSIHRDHPIPVSRDRKDLPANFDTWLGWALAPCPEHRAQNAKDLYEAFEKYVLAADAPPMPAVEGGASWHVEEVDSVSAFDLRPVRRPSLEPTLLDPSRRRSDGGRTALMQRSALSSEHPVAVTEARRRVTLAPRSRRDGFLAWATAIMLVASVTVAIFYGSKFAQANPTPAPSVAFHPSLAPGETANAIVTAPKPELEAADASPSVANPAKRDVEPPPSTPSASGSSETKPASSQSAKRPYRRNLGF